MKIKLLYNVLFCLLIVFIFASSISKSILVSTKTKKNVMGFLPQGWAFFTKSPREDLVDLIRYDSTNSVSNTLNLRNSSSEYLFGLSRKGRVLGYEISQILAEIPERKYINGFYNQVPPLSEDSILSIVPKKKLNLIKNGYYLVKAYKPIPWAWSGYGQEKNNPTKYIKILLINETN